MMDGQQKKTREVKHGGTHPFLMDHFYLLTADLPKRAKISDCGEGSPECLFPLA
jgi:hypothetical protein